MTESVEVFKGDAGLIVDFTADGGLVAVEQVGELLLGEVMGVEKMVKHVSVGHGCCLSFETTGNSFAIIA